MERIDRRIETVNDVIDSRFWRYGKSVTLDTARIKYRGLLQHALKYALWSLEPGGILTIQDSGPDESFVAPYTIPFSLVRMLVFQLLGRDTETLDLNIERRTIRLRRVSVPSGNAWQAGLIISGAPEEKETLRIALDGLAAQPELSRSNSILVSGPESARALLPSFQGSAQIEFVPYEGATEKPFPICKKKNHLIAAMSADKIFIIHARIKIDHGMLTKAPSEFDFAAPMIFVGSGTRRKPHISYTVQDAALPFRYSRRINLGSRSGLDPRMHMSLRQPFIDGGAFFANRQRYLECPLNNNLGWGDAEDVEWCNRAIANGFLVDYWPDVIGTSTVDKLGTRTELPNGVFRAAQFAKRQFVKASRTVRHAIELSYGQR